MKNVILSLSLILAGAATLVVSHADELGMPIFSISRFVHSPVTAAIIVEEPSQRPGEGKELVGVLEKAFDVCKVQVVGIHTVDKDKQTPVTLKPFFDAAAGKQLPQLVLRRGTDKYESLPCPTSMEKVQESLK